MHQLISLQKPADNVQGIISLRRNVYQCRPFGCLIWSSRSPSSDSANDYTNIWDVHFKTPPNVVTYQQIWAGEENMSLAIPLLKYSAHAPVYVRPSTSKCILHKLYRRKSVISVDHIKMNASLFVGFERSFLSSKLYTLSCLCDNFSSIILKILLWSNCSRRMSLLTLA